MFKLIEVDLQILNEEFVVFCKEITIQYRVTKFDVVILDIALSEISCAIYHQASLQMATA